MKLVLGTWADCSSWKKAINSEGASFSFPCCGATIAEQNWNKPLQFMLDENLANFITAYGEQTHTFLFLELNRKLPPGCLELGLQSVHRPLSSLADSYTWNSLLEHVCDATSLHCYCVPIKLTFSMWPLAKEHRKLKSEYLLDFIIVKVGNN